MNLTTADKILKVLYLPPVREQLNNATILLSRIEKQVQPVGGKDFTIPLHVSRNQAAGIARAENGTLPTAGAQGYQTAILPNKYTYGQIRVTGPALAATRTNAYAFVEALTSEMKGLVRDTKRAINRTFHSDGVDALAFYVSGTGTTAGVADDGQTTGHIFTHLPAGVAVTVDLLDASSSYAVLDSAVTLTRGASNGTTGYAVTASANISGTAADGDPWVASGTGGYAMMGIQGIIDDGDPALASLQGLAVASNPTWKAQSIGSYSSTQDISFALIQQGLSELAINSDYTEEDLSFFLMNFPVRDKFVELCTQERGWYNTMKIDGGWEAVEYNGKGFVADSQCRRGVIYGITTDTLKIYRSADFDWMDKDGAVLDRVSGVDAYGATLFHYGNLGVSSRNGNIIYKGINE